MMTNNKKQRKLPADKGAALIVVLGVVMVITVVAFAYLSRSDGELAYGRNMSLRIQADFLAESALEHARGLILNPQEVSGEYWPGAPSQQLEAGDFYYDVSVEPNAAYSGLTRWCNYDINCRAYRLNGGERTAQSNLKALLRLNPCIAYWSDTAESRQLSDRTTVNGDMYCRGDITNYGLIEGDAFGALTGTITGQVKTCDELTLQWPDVNMAGFSSEYTFESVVSPLSGEVHGPYVKCSGDLTIADDVQINGMLIVDGDLRISGIGNLIHADKALPALLVTGDVVIDEGAEVNIEGLTVVDGTVNVSVGCVDVNVLGGLFAGGGIVEIVKDSTNELNAIIHGEPCCVPEGGRFGIFFDGSDDYAQTNDSSDELQIINNYTLAVWVKANPTQKSWAAIVSKTDPAGSINHWTLQFDSSSPRKLVIHHPSGTWNTGITINDIASQWHHIAVTRSGNEMISYLDGVFQGSDTWIAVPSSGNGHLNIGVNRTASSSYTYNGFIDDVRIYNQVLDANDVNEIMNGSEITSGLIAHWKLDEDGQRQVTVTAAPAKTAIWYWVEESGELKRKKWAQATGAFYKVIRRN